MSTSGAKKSKKTAAEKQKSQERSPPKIINPTEDFEVRFEGNKIVLKYLYTDEERYFFNEHQQLKKIMVEKNTESKPTTVSVVGHDKHGYVLLREVFTQPLHPKLNPMPDSMTVKEVLDLYQDYELPEKIEFNDLNI